MVYNILLANMINNSLSYRYATQARLSFTKILLDVWKYELRLQRNTAVKKL